MALVELTVTATDACFTGILIACVADIPIVVADTVIADFQISLGIEIVKNIETGTKHEFEWTLILWITEYWP